MKKILSLVLSLALFSTLLCIPHVGVFVDDLTPETSAPLDENAVVTETKDRSSWQLTEAELNASTEELVAKGIEVSYEEVLRTVEKMVAGKKPGLLEKNLKALDLGYNYNN